MVETSFAFHFSDKTKGKKQNTGTPEKAGSPVASIPVLADEANPCTTGKVICGDDIESLAINQDELKKVGVLWDHFVIFECKSIIKY